MLDLQLLKPLAVFAGVAEAGSFRGAARRLGLSPASVSEQVAGLEARLGERLLYRSTRRMRLTEAGERVAAAARAMAEAARSASEAPHGDAPKAGLLRVTGPTILTSCVFARFLAQFRRAWPLARLKVDLSDARRHLIDDGFDLALRLGRLEETSAPARLLLQSRGIACASPRFSAPLARPEALEDLPWIRLSTLPERFRLVSDEGLSGPPLSPPPFLTLDNGALARSLVDEGAGFAFFPDFAVIDDLRAGRLVDLAPGWSLGVFGLYALYAAREPQASLARLFVDEFEAFLRSKRRERL